MKYRTFSFLKFISGALFAVFFFRGFIGYYCYPDYLYAYLISLIIAGAHLLLSYLKAHFRMLYFFEFEKELVIKGCLFLMVYFCAFIIHVVFELNITFENLYLLFLTAVILFVTSAYVLDVVFAKFSSPHSYYKESYRNASIGVVEYIKQQKEMGNYILDPVGIKKRILPPFIEFISINITYYDFFANNNGELIAYYQPDFHDELMKFSRENQIFYGKLIEDENYILDTRCNKVCISKRKFVFYDRNGKKCVFSLKPVKNNLF